MATKADNIYCLFSEENNHDQPPFNLVCWWSEKPTLEQVAAAMGLQFPGKSDSETMMIVHVWSKGKEGATDSNHTLWKLLTVPEGKPTGA